MTTTRRLPKRGSSMLRHQLEHTDCYVVKVHEETPECAEHGCSFHARSDHGMRSFPQHWRQDRGMMERICPHGIGHPDPDQWTYWRRTLPENLANAEFIHGCDGCCAGCYTD